MSKFLTYNQLSTTLNKIKSYVDTGLSGKSPTSHASTATTYGASSASNYGHAMASSTTPKAASTAAVGSETAKFARGDHVHPSQTTITGNAGTATKLQTARTIGKASFDGSANITLPQIMGYCTTSSSGNGTYVNKWTKFATVDLSGGTYRECSGQLIFSSKETDAFSGILQFYLRTGSAISSVTISLRWTELTNSSYATTVAAVKVSDGKYDLYFKPIANYTQMNITALAYRVEYLTLHSNQSYVDSITAAATSSLSGYVYNASTATKATQDSAGQQINTTYITDVNFTGDSISYTKGDGTTQVYTSSSLKWGNSRSITIGNTAKNVDGSANVSWSLSEIGAAASSHNHGLVHDTFGVELANTTTDSGWSMINSNYNGYMLKSLRTAANAPEWICNNYAAGIAFGGSDTKGVMSCAYNSPSIKFAGGNSTKPTWWIGLTGTSGTTYDLNRINTAYTHSQAAHAPSNAQKNSDITKAEIEAKLTGAITSHTHNYAAESHGNHVPTTQTANNAIFLRNDNTWQTVTPANIGAAASSHGTHLTIGTGASNAAAGNHTHNYAGSSSAGGAATSANKVNTNLAIKLNSGTTEGTNLFTFNGSTAKTVNITPSAIGAAESSHGTHLTLGTTSSTAYRGDRGNTAYTHSQATHAPTNAQKNSDITKAEIEAKLTGTITSHVHTKSSVSKYTDAYAWIDSEGTTCVGNTIDFVNGVTDEFGQSASICGFSSTDVNNHELYAFGHWFAGDIMGGWDLGSETFTWGTVYALHGLNTSSDRNLKENINYIRNNEILLMNNMEDEIEEQDSNNFTYSDLYDFVKTDLELATYNYKGKEENSLGFIAQDLLYNADGTDNKIGQFIVPPVVALTESELEKKKAEFEVTKKREATAEELKELATPKLEYNQTNYISVLAGALKEAISKIENLEYIVSQQQEVIDQLLENN